jgi:hypothetical protein
MGIWERIEENREVSQKELNQSIESLKFQGEKKITELEKKVNQLEQQNQELKLELFIIVQILETKGIETKEEFELAIEKIKEQQKKQNWRDNLKMFTLKSEL